MKGNKRQIPGVAGNGGKLPDFSVQSDELLPVPGDHSVDSNQSRK